MKQEIKTLTAKVGDILIGSGHHIVVQTMCNTHTYDEDATVNQCIRMHDAGAEIIRITVPGLQDVPHVEAIRNKLRSKGIDTPLVADIHFSSETVHKP